MNYALDMDGPLCDLVKGIFIFYKIPEPSWDEIFYKINKWDGISLAINSWASLKGDEHLSNLNESDMWREISDIGGSEFWHKIPATSWMRSLLEAVEYKDRDVIIISTPTKGCGKTPEQAAKNVGDCIHGKLLWVNSNIPQLIDRVNFARNKGSLAQPDRVLIDDGLHQIRNWRKSGGQAILFPSPQTVKNYSINDVNNVLYELNKSKPNIQKIGSMFDDRIIENY